MLRWLGSAALFLICAGVVILALGVIFRHSVIGFWTARVAPQKRLQK